MTLDDARDLLGEGDVRRSLEALAALDLTALSDAERGRVLALEAVCKDRLAEDSNFLRSFVEQVLQQVRPNVEFRRSLASEFHLLGESEMAEQLLRSVLSEAPDADLYAALGAVIAEQQRWVEAEQQYAQALQLNPDHEAAAYGRAETLLRQGGHGAAATAYRDYLRLAPRDQTAWIALARLELEFGNVAAAETALDEAEAIDSHAPAVLYERARACAAREPLRCAGYARRLAEVAPNDWRCHIAFAMETDARGEVTEAIALLERAFDAALAEADPILQASGVCDVLEFCERGKLHDLAGKFEGVLYSQNVLPDSVLAILRRIQGRWSERAQEFRILLEARAPVHASIPTGDFRRSGEQWLPFLRAYTIVQDTAEAAAQEAVASEHRSGALQPAVVEIRQHGEAGREYLGIKFRSGRAFYREQQE